MSYPLILLSLFGTFPLVEVSTLDVSHFVLFFVAGAMALPALCVWWVRSLTCVLLCCVEVPPLLVSSPPPPSGWEHHLRCPSCGGQILKLVPLPLQVWCMEALRLMGSILGIVYLSVPVILTLTLAARLFLAVAATRLDLPPARSPLTPCPPPTADFLLALGRKGLSLFPNVSGGRMFLWTPLLQGHSALGQESASWICRGLVPSPQRGCTSSLQF